MNFDEVDELLDVQEVDHIGLLNYRENRIQDRTNHFEKWNYLEFYQRFRLRKNTVMFELDLIENNIRHRTHL